MKRISEEEEKWFVYVDHQPETESLVLQKAEPVLLETSSLYSPASAVSAEPIFFVKDI